LEEKYPEISSKIHFYKGETYFNLNKFEKAIIEFQKAYYHEKEGDYGITAHIKTAQCYERLNKIESAKKILNEILKIYGHKSRWGKMAKQILTKINN
jgi:tetratricopeptide (TPR) repeat protein